MFGLDLKKEDIQNILFQAEINSAKVGTSYIELLDKYSQELNGSDDILAERINQIVRLLRQGKKRWDVYEGIVDEDVLVLLKMAEQKSISPDKIIENYLPVKNLISEYRKTIKRNLIGPIVRSVVVIILLGYTVTQFKKPMDDKMVIVSDFAYFIADNYFLLSLSIVGVVALMLFTVPHKLPLLKNIFKKLDSILAMATTNTMLQVGYSSAAIIPILKEQFKSEYVPDKYDIDGLVSFLRTEGLMRPDESAELKLAVTLHDPEETLSRFINTRKKDSEGLTKEAGKAVSVVALILTAIPIIFMVLVMTQFLMSAADMSQKAGM